MAEAHKVIDPDAVNAARERMQALAKLVDKGVEAAWALRWLSDHVDGREPEYMGFRVAPLLSDHLTRSRFADQAQKFLDRAAGEFKQRIADRAIELALADVEAGEPTS